MIYLDNSATTKPCDSAVKNINDALTENWGNPSSLYSFGVEAESTVNSARATIAETLNCREDEVIFLSGGTEANNLALLGTAESLKRRGRRIVSTSVEHPSVLNTLRHLESSGFEVTYIRPERDGHIDKDKVTAAITDDTILVSMMLTNNETGCIFPVREVAEYIKDNKLPAVVHCDAVQAFGKMPIDIESLGVDLLSASGHKIHASKGIGFLYKSRKLNLKPIIFGGNQESGLRSGTECVPLIAGLEGAIKELTVKDTLQRIQKLHDYAVERLLATGIVKINSPSDSHLPFVLNISVPGYRSETMLHFLESKGIFVSSGSACSKGKGSHVLNEMGLNRDIIDSALRISFSRYNTEADIDELVLCLEEMSQKLRKSKH